MDLFAAVCTSPAKVGDWVDILSPEIDLWEQAKAAQTLPYELFTAISARVERYYE